VSKSNVPFHSFLSFSVGAGRRIAACQLLTEADQKRPVAWRPGFATLAGLNQGNGSGTAWQVLCSGKGPTISRNGAHVPEDHKGKLRLACAFTLRGPLW